MTNLIKRKGLLSIMVIVVMVAMLSVACKNRTTGISLSTEEPTVVNPSEVLIPDGKLNIDKNRGLLQYDGKYFESKTYVNNDGTTFKYTVEIKNVPENNNTILVLKAGNQTKEYQQTGFTKGKGDQYNGYNSLRPYGYNDGTTLEVKFYNDENGGWVDVKPSNNSAIKLALKNK